MKSKLKQDRRVLAKTFSFMLRLDDVTILVSSGGGGHSFIYFASQAVSRFMSP